MILDEFQQKLNGNDGGHECGDKTDNQKIKLA